MTWHHEYWWSEVANKYSWANVVRFVMCQQHFFDVKTCMCSCLRYTSSSVQTGRSWPEWAAKRSSLFADSRESDSARQGSQMHPCTLLHTPAGFRRTDLKVINGHFQGWSALFFPVITCCCHATVSAHNEGKEKGNQCSWRGCSPAA